MYSITRKSRYPVPITTHFRKMGFFNWKLFQQLIIVITIDSKPNPTPAQSLRAPIKNFPLQSSQSLSDYSSSLSGGQSEIIIERHDYSWHGGGREKVHRRRRRRSRAREDGQRPVLPLQLHHHLARTLGGWIQGRQEGRRVQRQVQRGRRHPRQVHEQRVRTPAQHYPGTEQRGEQGAGRRS